MEKGSPREEERAARKRRAVPQRDCFLTLIHCLLPELITALLHAANDPQGEFIGAIKGGRISCRAVLLDTRSSFTRFFLDRSRRFTFLIRMETYFVCRRTTSSR